MKKNIRKTILKARMGLNDMDWQQKSISIFKNLCQLKNFKSSTNIMTFMDFKREVSTNPINDWILMQNKNLIIPRVVKNNPILELCIIKDINNMELSNLGIKEPKSTHKDFVEPKDIDFVIIPGVAFTTDGARLGYGGGYYDRIIPLMIKKPLIVAPAFELQIIDNLPLEPHDINIDMIVTESRIIKC